MNRLNVVVVCAVVLSTLPLVGASAQTSPPRPYTLELIPPPDGAQAAEVAALLDDGTVYMNVSYWDEGVPGPRSRKVMRWRDGEYMSLHGTGGLPAAQDSAFYTLSDAEGDDRLVGQLHSATRYCSFVLNDDGYRCDDDMRHTAINADGVVGGMTADGFMGDRLPHRLRNGVSEPLDHHGLGASVADIGPEGQLVGWTHATSVIDPRPVVWRQAHPAVLDSSLGGPAGKAAAVSDDGRIAGSADLDPTHYIDERPTFWHAGAAAHLPLEGAAEDINTLGQMLVDSGGPALFDGVRTTRLADLVPPGPTMKFPPLNRVRLNNVGQIAGTGVFDGTASAYLMSPVAPPIPPVTDLSAVQDGQRVTVTWQAPATDNAVSFVVRRKSGTTAPALATQGRGVPLTSPTSAVVDLPSDTAHSFAVFAVAEDGRSSAPTIASTVAGLTFRRVGASQTSATYGDQVKIRGRLVRTDTGAPMAGVPVELRAKYTLARKVTTSEGWVAFTVEASAYDTFHLLTDGRRAWPAAVSPSVHLDLYQSPTKLTMTVSDTDVDHFDQVNVTGRLTNAATGAPIPRATIWLYAERDDSEMTDADGRVTFSTAPYIRRDETVTHHDYSLVYEGLPTLAPAQSHTQTVTARMITANIIIPPRLAPALSGTQRTITAQVIRESTGRPEPERTVNMYSRRVGTKEWRWHSWQHSDAQGWVTFTDAPARSTVYRFVTDGHGYVETSVTTVAPVLANLQPRVRRRLVRAGTRTELIGWLSPALGGRTISLSRFHAGTWTPVATADTRSDGRYEFAVPIDLPRRERFRVSIKASADHLARTTELPLIAGYRVRVVGQEPGRGVYGEYTEFHNDGRDPVQLSNFNVGQHEGMVYAGLPRYALQPGETVRVYTGSGQERDGIHLRLSHELWPKGGAAARLYDRYGYIAHVRYF